MSKDIITNINLLKDKSNFISDPWIIKEGNSNVSFILISDNFPFAVDACVNIIEDLTSVIYINNTRVNSKEFQFILGAFLKCERYSKSENLLKAIKNKIIETLSVDIKLNYILSLFKLVLNDIEDEKLKKGVAFISEQLFLFLSKKKNVFC